MFLSGSPIRGRCACGGVLHQRRADVVVTRIHANVPDGGGIVLCDQCEFTRNPETPDEVAYAREVRRDVTAQFTDTRDAAYERANDAWGMTHGGHL